LALAALKKFEVAAREFGEAVWLKPSAPDYHKMRGLALVGLARFDDAIAEFDGAIMLRPERPDYHYEKGLALAATNRYAEAVQEFEEALRHDPDNSDCRNNDGLALASIGQLERALSQFDEAINLNRRDPEYHDNKGNVLVDLKRDEEAVGSFDEAIKLSPKNPVYHNNKGVALNHLKRFEEAASEHETAVKLLPTEPEYHNNLGNAQTGMKKFRDAIRCHDEAIRLDPANPSYYNSRGIAYAGLREFGEALKDQDKALSMDPEDASFHEQRGMALAGLKRFDEAIKEFDKALELDPNRSEYRSNRGLALSEMRLFGEESKAHAALMKVAADADDTEAQSSAGAVLPAEPLTSGHPDEPKKDGGGEVAAPSDGESNPRSDGANEGEDEAGQPETDGVTPKPLPGDEPEAGSHSIVRPREHLNEWLVKEFDQPAKENSAADLAKWLEAGGFSHERDGGKGVGGRGGRSRITSKKQLEEWLENRGAQKPPAPLPEPPVEDEKLSPDEHLRAAILLILRILNQADENETAEERGLEVNEVRRRLLRKMGNETPSNVTAILEGLVKDGLATHMEMTYSWHRKRSTKRRYRISPAGKTILVRAIRETDRII
jgi:tetratricopeptide (TPR) repeat protein